MLRSSSLVPLAVFTIGVAALPAAADGASLTFGRSCYLSSEGMVGHATGFRPNSELRLATASDWIRNQPAKADSGGKVRLSFFSRLLPPGLAETAVVREKLTLSDPRQKSRRAVATVHISNFVANWGKVQDPRVRRTWHFVGFRDKGTMYGHFVFRGKLVATHRFGDPAGPCGRMNARAAGLPIPSSKIRGGAWNLQFDMSRRYVAHRPGALEAVMTVPARYSTGR